ncbi:zinc-finger double domain-containing protein [Phthorimaea operculella]|nr:zinc-finger double domain-containing protein [Phthorimaea operculella]
MMSERKFKCPLCPKAFTTAPRLNVHNWAVHSGRKFTCTYCSEVFQDRNTRFKHLEKVHGVRKSVRKCNECDRTFDTPRNLLHHVRRHHLKERNFVCEQCGKRFLTKLELESHTVFHSGIKAFECDLCPKRYRRKSEIRNHIRRHMDDRPFRCKLCGSKPQNTTEPVARNSFAPSEGDTISIPNSDGSCRVIITRLQNEQVNRPQIKVASSSTLMPAIMMDKTKDRIRQTSKAPGRINIVWKELETVNTVPKIKNSFTLNKDVRDKRNPVRIVRCNATNIEKIRDNVYQVLKCSNATPIKSGGLSYVCCFCPQQFATPQELKQHNLDTHDDSDLCILTMNALANSFLVKVDITNLKCKLCNLSINVIEDLFTHLIDKHKRKIHLDIKNRIIPFKLDDENLKCAVCQIEYHTFKKLQEHMNTHYSNYMCDMCPAGFITPSKLAVHVRAHKDMMSERAFKCSLCPKAFTTNLRLKTHNKDVHSKRKITCTYCSEAFDTYKARLTHFTEVHGVRVADRKCHACDRTFDTTSSLTSHVKRNHLMMRNHACELCDHKCHTRRELDNHMLTHTGKKEFQCEFCDKRFGRKNILREHIRIHMNDRRFQCEVCEMKFVQKCSLKGHMQNKHGLQLT